MRHEAAFHDTVSPTDVITATNLGRTVCNAFDFIVLETLPQIITLIGAIVAIFSLYGPHVAVVQGFIVALNTLLLLRSNRTLMAFHKPERRHQGGLRGWRTVSFYGQDGLEMEDQATSLSLQIRLMWKSYLTRLGFRLVSGITVNPGHFTATALEVLHGLQTGRKIFHLRAEYL
ncbi:uncharacterized protein BDW70DRAFT_140151 [Aspergillus foveolatus]|uniref:uncharacterized protein n=1 Tax=Aspergillus foveolatus TaxID=210207 RepID=UPI003CCD51D5